MLNKLIFPLNSNYFELYNLKLNIIGIEENLNLQFLRALSYNQLCLYRRLRLKRVEHVWDSFTLTRSIKKFL